MANNVERNLNLPSFNCLPAGVSVAETKALTSGVSSLPLFALLLIQGHLYMYIWGENTLRF